MNADLAWRRSVAAGVAIDWLTAKVANAGGNEGMFLDAIAHALGRNALATLFPRHYQRMVDACLKQNETLDDQERQVLPLGQGAAMALLLESWRLPVSISEPLKHIDSSYASLAAWPDPLRTKIELLKLAVAVGGIASGGWERWDKIEIPPAPTMRRLGLTSLNDVIENTRQDAREIIEFSSARSSRGGDSHGLVKQGPSQLSINYCNLSSEPFDFLAAVLAAMGFTVVRRAADWIAADQRVLVNCLWTPACRLAARLGGSQHATDSMLVVCDADAAETYRRYGPTIALPASCGCLAAACEKIALPG